MTCPDRLGSPAVLLALCLGLCSLPLRADPPLLQNPFARDVALLHGDWRRIVDPYENGFYNHRYEEHTDGYFRNRKPSTPADLVEYDFDNSPALAVPGDWNTQDERLFFYEGTVWYKRDFDVDLDPGRRYVLYFGAVNYEAIVYVNGSKIGQHEGGFTPFQFDVTDALRDGGNFVVVKVDNARARDQVPTVNTDWWNYGGITRSVALIELGARYVADYRIGLAENSYERVAGWISVAGDGGPADLPVTLRIPALDIEIAGTPGRDGRFAFDVPARPALWRPGSPQLYDVVIEFAGSTLRDRVGFRRIAVDGDDILLNGEPVFLRGISIHEERPESGGRAWSEDHAERLLGYAADLGVNFVRLAHYPHNEFMVRKADELGLLVWSEIPVYWTVMFESDAVYANAQRQLGEMIRRDRNRASVILWSVANETPATEARNRFLVRLMRQARELDGSRLITAAMDTQSRAGSMMVIDDPLAAQVDVIGINSYCGWYGMRPEECAGLRWESPYGKPVVISEFGAGALRGLRGEEYERWTEDYQLAVYRHNLEMIDAMPFVRGMAPWILKDFRSPRRPLPGIQDFWNRKGLLSEDGGRKAAWQLLNDYYRQRARGGH